ncbi:MAG: iron donor protein CyaY [Rhodoferax sp.]
MTDSEYGDRAEALLRAVEAGCDRANEATDADLDNQRSGGMVTITFANRSQIVVNLQKPLHEVWLAARSGGYHFRWADDGAWRDTKSGEEFYALLARCASEQAGTALSFGVLSS